MSMIRQKAEQVAREAAAGRVGIDPMTVVTLIEVAYKVVTALVQMYRDCQKTPAEAGASMREPRMLERRRLKRLVRQHAGPDDVDAVHHAAIKVAAGVADAEVEEMYAESMGQA